MSEREKECSLCSTYYSSSNVLLQYWRDMPYAGLRSDTVVAVRRMFCCDRRTGPWQAGMWSMLTVRSKEKKNVLRLEKDRQHD